MAIMERIFEFHQTGLEMSVSTLKPKIKRFEKQIKEMRKTRQNINADPVFLSQQNEIFSDLVDAQAQELKRIETKLKESFKELENKKERMAVTVHDLKVPVTITLLNLELAEMEEEAIEKENYFTCVRRELEFLLDTIGNMLELEQGASSKKKLNFQEVDLRQLLDGVIARMHVIIKDKPDLKLKNDLPEDFPKLFINRHKIIRVFNNLFSNAIKYTEKGSIEVGGEIIRGNKSVNLFLKDTGKGIDEENLPKIFNFFQGDEQRMESTGVGLALVKQVIESHKGKVWIESSLGEGTKVILQIPIGKSGK